MEQFDNKKTLNCINDTRITNPQLTNKKYILLDFGKVIKNYLFKSVIAFKN